MSAHNTPETPLGQPRPSLLPILPNAHEVTPRFEDFRSYAHQQLEVTAPWVHGVCFLPECSLKFEPTRDWQIYCSSKCKQRAQAEFRLWGHRLALPSLVHQLGKYERKDEGLIELNKAARRHITRVQSAWLEDRQRRGAGT